MGVPSHLVVYSWGLGVVLWSRSFLTGFVEVEADMSLLRVTFNLHQALPLASVQIKLGPSGCVVLVALFVVGSVNIGGALHLPLQTSNHTPVADMIKCTCWRSCT